MNAEMIAALRELEREKGIAFETILGGLQEAMASAYKAHWKQEHPEADDEFVGFRAVIDAETGDLRMWQQELEEVDVPPVEGSDEPGLEMKVSRRPRWRSPTTSRAGSAPRPRSR